MRVFASLTTIPSRLPHIEQCLSSILSDQGFERVVLNIPALTLRGKTYPEEELEKLQEKFGDRLMIHRIPQDFGPITKLVGSLDAIDDPNAVIVVFDDDRELLQPVSGLFAGRITQSPRQAYSLGGWCFGKTYKVQLINRDDVQVDSLMGTTCIAFRRDLVDKEELLNFRQEDQRLIRLDDMRISGYWASKGVQRVVLGGKVRDYLRDLKYPGTESLSGNLRFWLDNKAVIDTLVKEGIFRTDSSGGLSIEWFVIFVLVALGLITTGLVRIYRKNRDGYTFFLGGLVLGVFAVFQLSSFML